MGKVSSLTCLGLNTVWEVKEAVDCWKDDHISTQTEWMNISSHSSAASQLNKRQNIILWSEKQHQKSLQNFKSKIHAIV